MITYHYEVEQLSDEWYALKCGTLSAGSFDLILTPTLKIAANENTRAHVYEMIAQRITKYVEPTFVNDEMLKGLENENEVRAIYEAHYGAVKSCGFVTNDDHGFTLGCSPDGLIGDDGGLEVKSRRQKHHLKMILDNYAAGTIPAEYMLQVQGSLLVTGRSWWDFVSYHGGLPMTVIRAYPDPVVHAAIIEAAAQFEAKVSDGVEKYHALMNAPGARLIPTERKIEQDMEIFV